jgi:hypothetical protein
MMVLSKVDLRHVKTDDQVEEVEAILSKRYATKQLSLIGRDQ